MRTSRRGFLKTLGGVALFSIVPRHVLGNGCEEVMKKNYLEIGKIYFEQYSDMPEHPFEKQCEAITNLSLIHISWILRSRSEGSPLLLRQRLPSPSHGTCTRNPESLPRHEASGQLRTSVQK